MAVIASDTHVRARQWKTRKRVVIKVDDGPVRGVVAGGAILRELRLQMIGVAGRGEIFEVATDAIRGDSGEVIVDMAVRASQGGVHAGQGKTCECSVIKLGAHPGIHVVAGLARRGQL